MTIDEIKTKLEAIRKRCAWLYGYHSFGTIPPDSVDPILKELEVTVNELKTILPEQVGSFKGHNYKEFLGKDGRYDKDVMHCAQGDIDYYLNIIPEPKESTETLSALKITKEGMFLSGQYFDAFLKMSEIIKTAKKDVIVIDGYIDEKLLQLFSPFQGKVTVRILTKGIKPLLQTFVANFNTQYNNTLDVRVNADFHDRFIIIDEKEFYHIGASIKDAGSRGFMFSQIEEPLIQKMLLSEFYAKW